MIFEIMMLLAAFALSYKVVEGINQRRRLELNHRHRMLELGRVEEAIQFLLVDKELGGEIYKQLSSEYAPPLLPPHEEEYVPIVHWCTKIKVYKKFSTNLHWNITKCGLNSEKSIFVSTAYMDKVTCKKCLKSAKKV